MAQDPRRLPLVSQRPLDYGGADTERMLRRLGQDAGCAPPGDEAAIAAAVGRLLDTPPPPVDPAELEPWDRAAVARRLAALLDRLSGEAPR